MNKEAMKQPECKTCGDKKEVEYEPDDIQGDVMIPCPDCQQPPAGEFTSKMRRIYMPTDPRIGVPVEWEYIIKACDRLDREESLNKDLLTACDIFQESIYKLSEGLCILCGGEDYPVCGDKKGYDEVDAEDAEEWRLAHKESCPLIIFEAAIEKAHKE